MTISDTNTVHIWIVETESNPDILDDYSTILSKNELDRVDKFNFEIDKVKYIFRRLILREILSQYADCKPRDLIYGLNFYQKPFIYSPATGLNLKFNVSYSNNFILVGITIDDEIGVDIEQIREFENMDVVAKDHFSKEDYLCYRKSKKKERINTFYKIWCAKESYIKAVGMGFYYPLDSFFIKFNNDRQYKSIILKQSPDTEIYWSLQEIPINKNYIACLTHKKKKLNLEIFNYK